MSCEKCSWWSLAGKALACAMWMFNAFAIGYYIGADSQKEWKSEAIKHGAAHYEVNDKGEVSFHWNNEVAK